MKNRIKGNGKITVTIPVEKMMDDITDYLISKGYDIGDYDGEDVECEIEITLRGWEDYDPGVYTYPNGDPGYPPSCEVEFDEPDMDELNEKFQYARFSNDFDDLDYEVED